MSRFLLVLFSSFPFYTKCISLSYVFSSPLFPDIAIALGFFFFPLPTICVWAYWQIVTCDMFAVLQDYRWLLPHTASRLPISLAYWVGFFLASEHHQRIYIKCFLLISQPRTFLLLMTSQITSWTSAGQRSSCKLLTTSKYMFHTCYVIDDKISLLLVKNFILWSSAKLSLEWRTSTKLKMDAMCKDTNVCSLCKPDSWNPHSCQIQQLELFDHLWLIHILGIRWHECLTNTDILFHTNGAGVGTPGKLSFLPGWA